MFQQQLVTAGNQLKEDHVATRGDAVRGNTVRRPGPLGNTAIGFQSRFIVWQKMAAHCGQYTMMESVKK